MTTPITQLAAPQQRVSALNIMGNRLKVDPAKLMQTLKATVFKNATDDELLALVVVANEYRLNRLQSGSRRKRRLYNTYPAEAPHPPVRGFRVWQIRHRHSFLH